MDSKPTEWGMGSDEGEDMEYDLAHDAPTASTHEAGSGADESSTEPDTLTYVATETPEYSGDLSYDLSHDVPGR